MELYLSLAMIRKHVSLHRPVNIWSISKKVGGGGKEYISIITDKKIRHRQ